MLAHSAIRLDPPTQGHPGHLQEPKYTMSPPIVNTIGLRALAVPWQRPISCRLGKDVHLKLDGETAVDGREGIACSAEQRSINTPLCDPFR